MRRRRKNETNYLTEEQGVKCDGFGEGHTDNRLNEDLTGSSGIAGNAFNGFSANECYAQCGGETAEAALDTTGDFCDDVDHDVCYFIGWLTVARTFLHGPDGKF